MTNKQLVENLSLNHTGYTSDELWTEIEQALDDAEKRGIKKNKSDMDIFRKQSGNSE